ncbi:hypothetical protein K8R30_00160 [archaeon]|nr:hypothetical protein [archaeon]
MGKQNVGKKLRMELDRVKESGLVPTEFENKAYLPFGSATKIIEKWEEEGKIACIERNVTPYVSRYIAINYASEETL